MKKQLIDLCNDDFGAILICAVRYSIGRQTYMPKLVIDFITPILKELPIGTLGIFERDIREHEEMGWSFGSDFDKAAWMKFLVDVRAEIDRRKQQ